MTSSVVRTYAQTGRGYETPPTQYTTSPFSFSLSQRRNNSPVSLSLSQSTIDRGHRYTIT